MNQLGHKKKFIHSLGNKMSGYNTMYLGHKIQPPKSSRSIVSHVDLSDGIVNDSNNQDTFYEPQRHHVAKPTKTTFNIEKAKKPEKANSHFV